MKITVTIETTDAAAISVILAALAPPQDVSTESTLIVRDPPPVATEALPINPGSLFDPPPGPDLAAVAFANTPADEDTPDIGAPPAESYPVRNANGIQVDGLGLPWDARINTDSRLCLVKKPNEWKVIRGTPPEKVQAVRAELRAAMSAGSPSPIPSTPVAPPPPSAPAPNANPVPPAPTGVTTFPELIRAIATQGIKPDDVSAAVRSVGLQSLPLLAARPDLLPSVAAKLGV